MPVAAAINKDDERVYVIYRCISIQKKSLLKGLDALPIFSYRTATATHCKLLMWQLIFHRRSTAEQGGWRFRLNLVACLFVDMFACQHDNFWTIKHKMM